MANEQRSRIAQYMDQSLGEAEIERLISDAAADPALARQLADALAMDRLLRFHTCRMPDRDFEESLDRALASEGGGDSCSRLAVRETSRRRLVFGGGATRKIAAAAVVAVGLWFVVHAWRTRREPVPLRARVTAAEAGVRVFRDGAWMPVGRGLVLSAGDRFETGERGGLRIDCTGEATWIEVGANTRIGFPETREGKRIQLAHGRIEVQAGPQPADRPMRAITPHAEAVVLGTRFTLFAAADATRLEVTEGNVRLTRRSDGAAVTVRSGEEAVVAPGAPLEVVPEEDALICFDFEDGRTRPDWIGRPVTEPAQPTGRFCMASELWEKLNIHRVVLADNERGLFHYRPGMRVFFDYWAEESVGAIDVTLWDRTLQSAMSHQPYIRPVKRRWTRVTCALDDFIGYTRMRLRDGSWVINLSIQSNRGGGRIFVDNVTIGKALDWSKRGTGQSHRGQE